MDSRLRDAPLLKERFYNKHGIAHYATGENHDYISDEILLITQEEEQAAIRVAEDLYGVLRQTILNCLEDPERLHLLGISDKALPLVQWSVENEWDDYLIGRFDFAGGLDGLPLRLLEFNADTASLLPETVIIQPEVISKAGVPPSVNKLRFELVDQLRDIKKARGNAIAAATHLGDTDDRLNLEVLVNAAKEANWKVDTLELPELIFDHEYGLLLEKSGDDNFARYYYLLKFIPWDWVLTEEPELWDLLEEMTTNHLLRVINPAWTMLLQSKALMAFAWQDNPGHPALLATTFDPGQLPNPLNGYVRKPIYGRMGENVMVSLNGRNADAETGGDYGNQENIYQELAHFGMDDEDYRYQLSVFMSPKASAICCRRQDHLILGDDAEFVPVGLFSHNRKEEAGSGWKFRLPW